MLDVKKLNASRLALTELAPGSGVCAKPAVDHRAWLKASAVFARLPELQRRVRELERRLDERDEKPGSSS